MSDVQERQWEPPAALSTSPATCANCGRRPGTIVWGDSLAVTHGWAVRWCAQCALRAQLAHAVRRAVRIPGMVLRLAWLWLSDWRTR